MSADGRAGPVRRPPGVPWLTLTGLAVTGLVTASQFVWAPVLPALQRAPAMLDGQYWRFVTTWLVHDGGLEQIAFNFPVLALLGSLVEWRLGRGWWLAAYVAGGLVGDVAGLAWQPVGGGNSVALCGLAGLFAVSQALQVRQPLPVRFGFPLLVLIGGLALTAAGNLHGPPLLAGLGLGGFAARRDPVRFGGGGGG